ncbi:hypothetical protein AALP_AA6G108100 [Arabis alpina]|uniref:Uncharacterized protein n=1 Tax=Arabis alpina TaxID=50452 RepID=A0A087GNF4_ARAAL|nr:hypothetical protein AALP_AA6G108100 [Arabis alpina]
MDLEDPVRLVDHPDDPRSSVYTKPDDPRSSGLLSYLDEVHGPLRDHSNESRSSVFDGVDPRTSPSPDPKTQLEIEVPMPSSCVDDPMWMRVGDIGADGVVGIGRVIGIDADGSRVEHADATETVGGTIPLNDEDPELPSEDAFASSSSYSSSSRASSDEDTFDEVQQTEKAKKAKKRVRVKVRPNPPGSSLSSAKSLRRLRRRCGISEEIVSNAPSPDDRDDAPPPGYMTLVRGRSEELNHTVTNSSGMALIAGFPSKDDHFEDRFFFVEISERTIEADCIDLVKTRWERRGKGIFPRIGCTRGSGEDQEVIGLQHAEGGGSNDLDPDGSAGEIAEFRRLSAERTRISSGKGKGIDRETPSKRQRMEAFPATFVGREASASRIGGLLGDEAYSVVKSKASEDGCSRDSELSAAKEANAALQSRLDELAERSKVLERDALSVQKVKKDYEDKLTKLKSRIEDAVAEVNDEMARGFLERTREVAGLLAEIGGKAQNDMLNLTEINANLEFIGLLRGSQLPDLLTEIPVVPAGAAEASVAVAVEDDDEVSDEDDVEATDDDEDAEDWSSFFFLVFQT